jgi:hypothetical protein
MPDIDIWRCAKLMVDQHGEWAQIEAIDKATLMVGCGDLVGQHVWLRVFEAIGEMQSASSDEQKH